MENCKTFTGKKSFDIAEVKAVSEGGVVRISGYANTKYVADRYGDISMPFGRNYVYELEDYKKNPVLMLDHWGTVKNIAGGVTEIHEDEKGLYFEATLSNSALPEVAHARKLIEEGFLKTVSIGGTWFYEDKLNESHLTLAKIYEISLVAIPADPNATFTERKNAEETTEPETAKPEDKPQAQEAKQADTEAKAEEAQAVEQALEKMFVFEAQNKIKQFEAKLKGPKQGKE